MRGDNIRVTSSALILLLVQYKYQYCCLTATAAFHIRPYHVRSHIFSSHLYKKRKHRRLEHRSPDKSSFSKQVSSRNNDVSIRKSKHSLDVSSKTNEKNATSSLPRYATKASTNNNNHDNPKSTCFLKWLDQATRDMLDLTRIPLGLLTTDDVEHLSGLMASWTKRKSTKGALTVETLLKRVVDDHNAGNMSVNVTTRMYTMAIDAWAKVGGRSAAERADMIHAGMVEMYRSTGDINIRPNTISYNTVINAWSKSGFDGAADMAENILENMIKEWKSEKNEGYVDDEITNSCCIKPDAVSFTSVIDAWAKSPPDQNGASKAMILLKRMNEFYKEEGDLSLKPTVYTYSACMNAFARSAEIDAPHKAELLLDQMKAAYEAGDMDVKPNVVNYNSVINAWGKSRGEFSANRAAEILDTMEAEGVEPDILSYSLVVHAWSHSSGLNATREAEKVLERMEKWAKEKNQAMEEEFYLGLSVASDNTPSSLRTIPVRLDLECYNSVLIALSRRQESDGPKRALALLRKMISLADSGFETVRPTTKSLNCVLSALSRDGHPNSVTRAEELLDEMYDMDLTPDAYSFASLLISYQKRGWPGDPNNADNIVRTMENMYFDGALSSAPDVYHYTIVCSCWARSGQKIAAQRCQQILDHMKARFNEGHLKCKPNIRTYNAVIDAYARGHYAEEAQDLLTELIETYKVTNDVKMKPEGFTFNAAINAWTRSGRKESGEQSEKILKKLLDFHNDGNPDVLPDTRSFSHIIDFYSKSRRPGDAERAEWLLMGMIEMFKNGYDDVVPNIFCFSSVISCYASSKMSNAGIKAEQILHYLEDLHNNHQILELTPNTFIMNAVLNAWSKAQNELASERAEEILLHMEKQYESGDNHMKPNTRSYGLVLATWAKSSFPDKSERAQKILRLMSEKSESNTNVSVNAQCYNAVVKSAAFTEGSSDERMNAFNVATVAIEELLDSNIKPVSPNFGTYLKACGKLSLPRNVVDPQIEKIFTECKELGLVNTFVLTQLSYSASPQQYEELVGKFLSRENTFGKWVGIDEIPSSWRRNCLS